MTTRSAQHGTIRLERRYKAAPARVFAAWAEPEARAKWDVPGRWLIAEQTFDFRDIADTLYLDIVPDRRIVFSYSMTSRGTPISVSLTTVELSPAPSSGGRATHLLLTEQIVFLDGNDNAANREEGLASMLDKIGEALLSAPNRS